MTTRILRHRRHGFSMLELLIVLAIMAIAAAFALPAVGRSLAAARINRSAAVVASTMRESWGMAARRRRPLRVSIDTTRKILSVRDDVTPDSLFLRQYFNSRSELGLNRLTTSDTQIVIFPNGIADGAVTITLQINGKRRQVTVTRAGQVRVRTP